MKARQADSPFKKITTRCMNAACGLLTLGLVVLLLSLDHYFASAVWAKTPEMVPAIRFQQLHRFFGKLELTISKIGVKIACHDNMSFNVVAKAPVWNVTVYRDDDKTFFQETLNVFRETGLVSGIILSFHERESSIRQAHPAYIQMNGFKLTKLGGGHRIMEYMELGKDYPPAISEVVWSAYKQPTNGGIPVYITSLGTGKDMITGLDETGHSETQVTTFNIKNVMVPLSEFDPPAGYRKVKSITEVALSAKKRDESEAFQIMFDQPKPKIGPIPKH